MSPTPLKTAKSLALAAATSVTLGGCALLSPAPTLPPAVDVPSGHSLFMSADAEGSTIRVCRAQGNACAWSAQEIDATLRDGRGTSIGRVYGMPMTWEAADGSIVTGHVVAAAPAEGNDGVFQLIRANPATGQGAMRNVSFIQRTAFAGSGSNALSAECTAARVGETQRTPYRASFRFFKPRSTAIRGQ
ncbi:MAG: DUF3455 domain-containing protein [Burkholderiales bacterium]